MSEQENLKAALTFYNTWEAGSSSQVEPNETDDFMAEGPGVAAPMNGEQNLMYLGNFKTAFPDSKFEVLRTISQGDYVVTHWKFSGSHTGPLHSPSGVAIPATHKKVAIMGSTTFQYRNGKTCHSWSFWDLSSLLGQLGLLPPM